MSLDWNFIDTKTKDPTTGEELWKGFWKKTKSRDGSREVDELDNSVLLLIWFTMVVGLRSITTKNLEEWYFRLAVCRQMGLGVGKTTKGNWYPGRKTLERIAVVGLSTNANNMTRKQFLKKMGQVLEDEVTRWGKTLSEEDETLLDFHAGEVVLTRLTEALCFCNRIVLAGNSVPTTDWKQFEEMVGRNAKYLHDLGVDVPTSLEDGYLGKQDG